VLRWNWQCWRKGEWHECVAPVDAAVDELFKCYRRGTLLPEDSKEEEEGGDELEKVDFFCGRQKQSHLLLKTETAFLGAWDTVDAIGVPFDWLRDLIYATPWVREYDHDYNAGIQRAAHAIAIDDQRATFHPLMFSEPQDPNAGTPNAKVVQVWFAGMHSNVGGSYPKDELSLVPLVWMMEQAEKGIIRTGARTAFRGKCESPIRGHRQRARDDVRLTGRTCVVLPL
jgi:uncharacterized protein (DUF2235 family)